MRNDSLDVEVLLTAALFRVDVLPWRIEKIIGLIICFETIISQMIFK